MSIDWNSTVRQIGPRLYRYFNVPFSPEVADDLTQETLIRLVRKVEAGILDPEKGSLDMFAFGIAYYVKLENMARMRRWNKVEAVLTHEGSNISLQPDAHLEDKERAEYLRKAIAQLSQAQQDVVLLGLDEELTMDQMAAILELPLNTIKSHLRRAKETLAQLLSAQVKELEL